MYYEDLLLRALCFDLAVDHPYVPLVRTVRELHVAHAQAPSRTLATNSTFSAIDILDGYKAKSLAQSAWSFVNDSLLTPLCVMSSPQTIAAAAFLLAVAQRAAESASELVATCSLDETLASSVNNVIEELDWILCPPSWDMTDPRTWWQSFGADSLVDVYGPQNLLSFDFFLFPPLP